MVSMEFQDHCSAPFVYNQLYYLTKPFGMDAFSIRWYAQVRSHELVTRRELLPDESDHPRAGQRY